MVSDQIAAAIASAHGSALDDLSRAIWAGLAQGIITDDAAQALAEQIHARRKRAGAPQSGAAGSATGNHGRRSIFPPRKPQRPPLRPLAIARRRRLAASGPLPPALACLFTTGEMAVLRIVGDECRDRRACLKPIDAIAARAGVGRTTTQNALRRAARLGLLKIEERRVRGAKNLPNRTTIVSAEWNAWIARGPRAKPIAFKKLNTTDTVILRKEAGRDESALRYAARRGMRRPHDVGK